MKSLFAAIALLAPTLATAADPASAPAAISAPVDPARLELARKVAASVVPPGTMQRVMKASMDDMNNKLVGSMFDMKASDIGETGADKDKTLRQSIAEKDPHFEERMKITNRVLGEEMGAIAISMEPGMREGMARAYARRFTMAELSEIDRFFSSPAGASFARQSYELMADPEITAQMMTMMPEMMKQMPAIMEKVKKATAHLPEPPAEEDEDPEEETVS